MLPRDYREPDQLPEGGVLIVGASSTGVQLAEEIHASGRPVTLAVGDHTPAPRRYRGRDIFEWLGAAGILDETTIEGVSLERTRRQPSLQLVGRPDNRDINLAILSRQGIRLTGRLAAIARTTACFKDDLPHTTRISHARTMRALDRIDETIQRSGLHADRADPAARVPFQPENGPRRLDLAREGIRSVVWATGYVRRYPWLKVPVLDSAGELVHRGGLLAAPGLYVLGLTSMRRRRSSFIDGCGRDAEDLAPTVKTHLDRPAKQVA
jgi:putative flavoprotein involved in K+ transport